jgi:Tol biopolymer transport system component/DNA-binding winged helix-turn-helix (wHTH) protein
MDEKPLLYQFDDIQIEPQSFKVWRAGQPLPLEPKAFEVLFFLLKHRERLVEKQELLDAVWKETFVTPNALTRVIAQLRKSLGDDPKESRYIETVPTRGYRFVAEVQLVSGEPKSLPTASTRAPEFIAPGSLHENNGQEAPGATLAAQPHIPSAMRQYWKRTFPTASLLPLLSLGLLLLLVLLVSRRESVKPAGIVRTTQLTTTPGLDIFPAFSPDCGVIAYSSLRSGTFELFARQLAPGGREIQITADGAQNLQPAWSPDGKLIAYHSRKRGGIWVAPALGGVARQLTDFGAHPAWSPDGAWIAFQSETPADLNQAAFGALPPSTLWLVPARGGTPQPITKPGAPPGGHGLPSWSPDGRRLVFVTSDIGLSEIWSVTPQGGELQRVRSGPGTFYDPVYAPDGQTLFFSSASGNFHLWRMRVDAATGQSFEEPVELANTGQALARHLTVSADGRRLAYSSLTLTNNIGTVPLDPATATAQGEPRFLTQDTNYRKTNHTFSPDGRYIAYNVWRMGADGEIWLMEANGKEPRQLTTEAAALLGWLPQGQQVLLMSKNTQEPRVFKIDVASGQQTTLGTYQAGVRMGRLSSDGQQLAYNSRASGAVNVWTLSLANNTAKQLTFDQIFNGFPCWSPDGQWLAFEIKRGAECQIAVLPREGGTPEQLTFGPGQNWPGSWSPDGDKITFAGQRDGQWNIWWVSRRTKTQQQITRYTTLNSYVRYPAWSPRGEQIIYEYGETFGNVWLAELR